MRLRYLHIRNCPPLDDVRVVFGQETLLQRNYAINFVVGINGTGKSTLLRALYTVFRHLGEAELPPFPVTLAYDVGGRTNPRTVLFHHPGGGGSKAFFYVTPAGSWPDRDADGWDRFADTIGLNPNESTFVSGAAFQGNNLLMEFLPKHVIAYTSGTVEEWHKVGQPVFPQDELPEELETELPEERPAGWTVQQELLSAVEPEALATESGQALLTEAGQSIGVESAPVRVPPLGRCRLLTAFEIKLAGLAFGIWHAFMEFSGASDATSQDTARRDPLPSQREDQLGGARRMVDQVDWLWPTHLSLTLKVDAGRMRDERRAELLCLMALADAGVEQPRGRGQLVVPLSRLGRYDIAQRLAGRFPKGELPQLVSNLTSSIGRAPNGAEALCRLFHLQPHLWATCEALRQWHQEDLIENATLTIRRKSDDGVIVYEGLSDGEQMLLGRMALLFLLNHRDDSLLLLDEPETHFNDFWKREIVDIIHDNLKDTAVQILVATHSSIALSDAFAAEIVLLEKRDGAIEATAPTLPTFGEEPGEIMVRLFGAPETIGQRAAEWLDQLIRQTWKPEQREELESIIQQIGAGYYRSELRAALKQLGNAPPH